MAAKMPRQARLDYPGAIHHVMVRGVAGAPLYVESADYSCFIVQLKRELKRGRAQCMAWSLMPNHAHLLLQTGPVPLWHVMQRMLLRYAGWFNNRHHRYGHLFQNRYKSLLCDKDAYLLDLVRYIHLNPLRAGLVKSIEELARYPWTGHAGILGIREIPWQGTDEVLALFSSDRSAARRMYSSFVAEGSEQGRRQDLEVAPFRPGRPSASSGQKSEGGAALRDARILGDGRFIARVAAEVKAAERRRGRSGRRLSPLDVIRAAAKAAGVTADSVQRPDKRPAAVVGRALACKWLVDELGMKGVAVAKLLRVSPSAVTLGVERGRRIERERGLSLGRATQ